MSFIGLYLVKGWNGSRHLMTAKRLYKRVIEDSKYDFNWIASATELVRVCMNSKFPEKYAIGIKTAILNCFANLETKGRWRGYTEPTDDDAVYYCYNSLSSMEEEVLNAKQKYLAAIIHCSSRVPHYNFSFHLDGETYLKLREEWRKKKLDELAPKKDINFKELIKELEADFSKTVKIAEDGGTFKEDDDKWHQEIHKLLESIISTRRNDNESF